MKQLRHFLGMVQYYRDLWARQNGMLPPLTSLVGECGQTKTTRVKGTKKVPFACRQKITFTSNLKLIISFLDHKYHSLLQLLILVASTWQAIETAYLTHGRKCPSGGRKGTGGNNMHRHSWQRRRRRRRRRGGARWRCAIWRWGGRGGWRTSRGGARARCGRCVTTMTNNNQDDGGYDWATLKKHRYATIGTSVSVGNVPGSTVKRLGMRDKKRRTGGSGCPFSKNRHP